MINQLNAKESLNVVLINISLFKKTSMKESSFIKKEIMCFENDCNKMTLFSSTKHEIFCLFIIEIDNNVENFISNFSFCFKRMVKSIEYMFANKNKTFIKKDNLYRLLLSAKYDFIKRENMLKLFQSELQKKISKKYTALVVIDIEMVTNNLFTIDFRATKELSLIDTINILKNKTSKIANKYIGKKCRVWHLGYALSNTNQLDSNKIKNITKTKEGVSINEKIKILLHRDVFTTEHFTFFQKLGE